MIKLESYELCMRSSPGMSAIPGYGSCSAFIRSSSGKSFHNDVDLLPHRFSRTAMGRAFCDGGTGRLVDGLVRLIEGQGGTVRCGAAVDAITVANGAATGIRLASGEVIDADIVVSNADSAWTYRHLLPPHARRRWTDRRIERSR
jgi:phytoene dehydrogenase-like protein